MVKNLNLIDSKQVPIDPRIGKEIDSMRKHLIFVTLTSFAKDREISVGTGEIK